MCECVPTCVSVHHLHAVPPVTRRGCWSLWRLQVVVKHRLDAENWTRVFWKSRQLLRHLCRPHSYYFHSTSQSFKLIQEKVYLLFILIRVVSIFSILYPVCKFLLLTFLRIQTSWCWGPLDFIRLRQSLCFLQIWNTLLPSINLWVARLFSLILIHAFPSANLLCHQAFSMDNVPLFHCFLSISCYYCF